MFCCFCLLQFCCFFFCLRVLLSVCSYAWLLLFLIPNSSQVFVSLLSFLEPIVFGCVFPNPFI